LTVNVNTASGISAASMANRATLRHPSGRDGGGRRTVVAAPWRRVVAGAARPGRFPRRGRARAAAARQSIVRPTNRAVALSLAPQAQKNRILSSAAGTGSGTGAAAGGFPHLGQPAGLISVSKPSPQGQVTKATSEVYPRRTSLASGGGSSRIARG
jgi:hypothetical protein